MNSKLFLLLMFCIQFAFSGLAQELYFEQYTVDDGLPSNTVYEIVQDSTGLLWFGTENGLVSYDGTMFSVFRDDHLKDNDIIELQISVEGHVTFTNFSNQYCRIEGKDTEVVDLSKIPDLSQGLMFSDLFSHEGVDYVYAGGKAIGANMLFRYDFHGLRLLHDSVYHVNVVKDGLQVSSARSNPRMKIADYELQNALRKNGYLVQQHFYNEVLGYYFFYTHGRTNLHVYSSGENCVAQEVNTCFLNNEIFERALKRSVLYDVHHFDGLSLFGFEDGLYILDQATQELKSYLDGIVVQFLFEDREGNLWISTGEHGLLKTRFGSKSLTVPEGISTEVINLDVGSRSLLLTNDAVIGCANYPECTEVYSFDGDSKPILVSGEEEIAVLGKGFVFSLDRHDMSKGQICEIDDETFFSPKAGCFVDGSLIYADRKRVYEVSNMDKWNKRLLFKLNKTQVIEQNKGQGELYLGTANGLYFYSESTGVSEIYRTTLSGENIVDIKLSEDRQYIGTANSGCYIFEQGTLIDSVSTRNGLPSNAINDIAISDEYVYIATTGGLAQYDVESKGLRVLTEFEGLVDGNPSAIAVDTDGRLFISQKKGFIEVLPEDFKSKSIEYDLLLESVMVNNVKFEDDQIKDLSYQENKIDLEFNYITMQSIGRKRLRYRIGDDPWEVSDGLSLRLPSLEPGLYEVEVMGILREGRYTEPQKVSFRINKPWWQTLWFRIFAVLAVLGVLAQVVRLRTSRVRKEEASKRAYLQQINEVKDQALQLQMNPHFVFNAMNAIQHFVVSRKEEAAANYLARFAKLIRFIFEYSSRRLITVEEELEFVGLYLDLEGLRFDGRTVVNFEVDPVVEDDKDLLFIPPLLVQPVIENSFKHGLFHKSSTGVLTVRYGMVGDLLTIVVEDNGIGRVASHAMKNDDEQKDRPSGLRNIGERLKILNFNNQSNDNRIEVEDLYIDGKAQGTRTILTLAINENH